MIAVRRMTTMLLTSLGIASFVACGGGGGGSTSSGGNLNPNPGGTETRMPTVQANLQDQTQGDMVTVTGTVLVNAMPKATDPSNRDPNACRGDTLEAQALVTINPRSSIMQYQVQNLILKTLAANSNQPEANSLRISLTPSADSITRTDQGFSIRQSICLDDIQLPVTTPTKGIISIRLQTSDGGSAEVDSEPLHLMIVE